MILLRTLILIFGLLMLDVVLAGVYRCVDEHGAIKFSDKASAVAEADDFLPYVYQRSDPTPVFEKEAMLDKTKKISQEQLAAAQKKQERLEARQKKSAEKAAAKTERRLARCEKTREKIKQIEAELRVGCKPRRNNTLKKQLIHAEKMQQRYCSPS